MLYLAEFFYVYLLAYTKNLSSILNNLDITQGTLYPDTAQDRMQCRPDPEVSQSHVNQTTVGR